MGCTSSKAMEAQARMEGWDGEGPMPKLGKGGFKSLSANDSPNHIVALTSSTLRKYSPTEVPATNLNQWGDEKLSKVAPADLKNSLARENQQVNSNSNSNNNNADDKHVDPLEEVVKKMKDEGPQNGDPKSPNDAGKHVRGVAITGSRAEETPIEWEAVEPETIDVWELMEGIDDEEGGAPDSETSGGEARALSPKGSSPKVASGVSSPHKRDGDGGSLAAQRLATEKTSPLGPAAAGSPTAAMAVASVGGGQPEARPTRKPSAPPAPGSSAAAAAAAQQTASSEPAGFEPGSPGKRQKTTAGVAPQASEAVEKEVPMKEPWAMPKWNPSARPAGSFDAAMARVSSDSLAPGDAISPSVSDSDSLSQHRRSCPEELASLKGMLNQTLATPEPDVQMAEQKGNNATTKESAAAAVASGGEKESRGGSDADSLSTVESSTEQAMADVSAASSKAPTKKKTKKSSTSRSGSMSLEGKDSAPKEKVVTSDDQDLGKAPNRALSTGSMSSASMSADMDVPLFDPDLLASFEEAFQSVTEEEWSKGLDGEKDPLTSHHTRSQSAASAVSSEPSGAANKPKIKKSASRGKTPSPGRKRSSSKSIDATPVDKAAATAPGSRSGADKPRRDRFGTGSGSLSRTSSGVAGSSSDVGGGGGARKVLEEAPGANSNAGGAAGTLWPPATKKAPKVAALTAAFQQPPPGAAEGVVVDKKEVIVSHSKVQGGSAPKRSLGGESDMSGSGESVRDVRVVPASQQHSERAPLSHIEWGISEVARRHLGSFDEKPPPRGEGKLVLYTTTMRAVRKTFEDCNNLRQMLQAYGVAFDERDVSMHSEFREELRYLLGKLMPVPRLFIFGRYIGGATEVEQMNEEGTFEALLAGLPSADRKPCAGCGNVRFVPCPECSGSCKIVVDDEVERCPDCNENGLVRCPICCS